MFGSLFGNKKKIYFTCKVYMNRPILDAMLAQGISTNEWMVITFFPATRNTISEIVNNDTLSENIILADKPFSASTIQRINSFLSQPGRKIVFGERHPLSFHEDQVAEKLSELGISLPIIAFASLDDALLQRFGSEKAKGLMLSMGMKAEEVIEHSMIEKSIEKAQSKIAKKVFTESKTNSAEDWLRMNFPAEN
ncbi:MAG: hypothetical protein NT084_06605 [Bacteroidetes bacterium]|nr:hypothetical protein [Bacteroidota bacterium]